MFLLRLYRYLNILSVDVALGAVCSAVFFSRIFHVQIRTAGLFALALTVWIIYTVDHLLDARKIQHQASTERHHFHQQHSKLLWVFVLVAIGIVMILIFFIRKPILVWGITGGALMIVYLAAQQYLKFMKEVFIAILYTCGVLLPSMAVTQLPINEWPWLLIVLFSTTALINLLLFSWFDWEQDISHQTVSFVTVFGKGRSGWVISALFVVIGIGVFFIDTQYQFMLLGMNVILLFLFLFSNLVRRYEAFRLLGDFIFILPILFVR